MAGAGLANGSARLFSNPAGDYGSMVNERVGAGKGPCEGVSLRGLACLEALWRWWEAMWGRSLVWQIRAIAAVHDLLATCAFRRL